MIAISGRVTPEEVAAIVIALQRADDEPTPYDRWRAGRLAALRRTPRGSTAVARTR